MSDNNKLKILTDEDVEKRVEAYNRSLVPSMSFWGIFPTIGKMIIRNIKGFGNPDTMRAFNPQAKIMDEQVKRIEEPPSAMDKKEK